MEVGRVARVELTGPASVRVLLHVRKEAPVTSATVATITSRGLASKGFTGYVYVALEDDGSPAQPLAAAPAGYPQLRTARVAVGQHGHGDEPGQPERASP